VDTNRLRTTRRAVTALALTGGLVAMAACGDDDDKSPAEQPTATTTAESMMDHSTMPADSMMTEDSMMTGSTTP
jgi:hypothetical protein